GKDDDRRRRLVANLPDHLDAIEVRQPEVEEDQVGAPLLEALQRLLAVLRRLDLEVVPREVRAHGPQDGRLIVDNQDARAGGAAHARAPSSCAGVSAASGNVNRKRAPPPGRFSAQMRPPCASTRPRTTASPTPVPRGRGPSPSTR